MKFKFFLFIVIISCSTLLCGFQAQKLPDSFALNVFVGSACQEAIGVDCTKDPQMTNLHYDILSSIQSRKTAPNQSAIVQQYLVPMVRKNIGMQQDIIGRAFKALGRSSTSTDETQWTGKFESWQTYQRLVPLVKQTPAAVIQPVKPPAPTFTPQQNQQAVVASFIKIYARNPNYNEYGKFTTVDPAAMDGAVRSSLNGMRGDALNAELNNIINNKFPLAIGRQPTSTEKNGLLTTFNSYWTGADDLSAYLTRMAASYKTATPAIKPNPIVPVAPTVPVNTPMAKTPQNGWDKMLNQWERCFGGVGPGCGGVPGLAPVTKNADGSVTTYVAVGSILHDNCCLRNGNAGTWCGELNPQNVIMDELSLKHLVGACAMEWSKAVYNVRDRRWWAHTFGPYKGTEGGDDLTQTSNRHAKMSLANSPVFVDYSGGETNMTRSLKAPNGTNLDIDDEEFCESGHFVEVHNMVVGVGRWGVCGPKNQPTIKR